LRCASIEAMLVLIERVMMFPWEGGDCWKELSGKSTGVFADA